MLYSMRKQDVSSDFAMELFQASGRPVEVEASLPNPSGTLWSPSVGHMLLNAHGAVISVASLDSDFWDHTPLGEMALF